MPNQIIQVKDLCKTFGKLVAVDHISFSVPQGSTCALLGANGAGKTTTLSMLLGLLLPTSGAIKIMGVDIPRDRYKILSKLSFTSPYVDLPQRLTVEQNLTVYAKLYGVQNVKNRVVEIAEKMQILDHLKRPFGSLSAGQRTHVVLAKSLIHQPEVLLMDEPTSSLDPDSADRIRTLLSTYKNQHQATILLASHNMFEVERLCDNVLIMKDGKLIVQGTPAALINKYSRNTLEEVFLDIARNNQPN